MGLEAPLYTPFVRAAEGPERGWSAPEGKDSMTRDRRDLEEEEEDTDEMDLAWLGDSGGTIDLFAPMELAPEGADDPVRSPRGRMEGERVRLSGELGASSSAWRHATPARDPWLPAIGSLVLAGLAILALVLVSLVGGRDLHPAALFGHVWLLLTGGVIVLSLAGRVAALASRPLPAHVRSRRRR